MRAPTPKSPSGAVTPDDGLVGADRVLALLRRLAHHPSGASLDELTTPNGGSKPTVHRALQTLRRAGFARQDESGRYHLGDDFVRLAFQFREMRPDHQRVQQALEALSATFGETSHFAVLDGGDIVYRAKVDPPTGAVRLTSTIGGRNPAHATGVGKAILAQQLPTFDHVVEWASRHELNRRTVNTRCTIEALHEELERTRTQGYATDDEENEIGVNCVAVPIFLDAPNRATGAISVSALVYRTPLATLVERFADIWAVLEGEGLTG